MKPDERTEPDMKIILQNKTFIEQYKIIGPHDIVPLVELYSSKLKDLWDKIPLENWVIKSDLGRLLYIYYNSGIYLDTDCIIQKNFNSFFSLPSAVGIVLLFTENILPNTKYLGTRECKNYENRVRVANYAFGTNMVKSPFLKEVIDECIVRLNVLLISQNINISESDISESDILWVCGPDVITSQYHILKEKYNNLILLDQTYLKHLSNGLWRNDKIYNMIMRNRCMTYKYTKLYNNTINQFINQNKLISEDKLISEEDITSTNIPLLIPLNIFQTWHTHDLAPDMSEAINLIQKTNPEFKYYMYDDKECLQFIKEHFDESVANTYMSLIPGAYKADLWRYCILYIYGGVYLDIKFVPQHKFKFIHLMDKEYFVLERPGFWKRDTYGIWNGFMICKAKNEVLRECIYKIVDNVKTTNYDYNLLYPTGPGLLGEFFFNKKYNSTYKFDTCKFDTYKFELFVYYIKNVIHIIYNNNIILREYNNYRAIQHELKISSYSELYENKNIYTTLNNYNFNNFNFNNYNFNIKKNNITPDAALRIGLGVPDIRTSEEASSFKKIICFLTLKPSLEFYNFCKTLINKEYDVYICIDDNSYTIPQYDGVIKIIQIDNQECIEQGFKSSVSYFYNQACSRDKALYYFCRKYDSVNNNINNNKQYEHIWFIEEDVFIPTNNTLMLIDSKYKNGDLLCRDQNVCDINHMVSLFNTVKDKIHFNAPYTQSMICAIRISKKILNHINDYVNEYRELFLDELLFTTIAKNNDLAIINPEEFSTIFFNRTWRFINIKPNYLYHPLKDSNIQFLYHKRLL
jgi:mannosyltransferase OCH1-like enzyme